MNEFRTGQEVDWDDYVYVVVIPSATREPGGESETLLHDPVSREDRWVPTSEIEEY